MVKGLLVFVFSLAMAVPACVEAAAKGPSLGVLELADGNGIDISVDNATLRITGAEGMTLEVVSLTGRRVATVKIESSSQVVELNIPQGCYILKVGSVVRKVSIR